MSRLADYQAITWRRGQEKVHGTFIVLTPLLGCNRHRGARTTRTCTRCHAAVCTRSTVHRRATARRTVSIRGPLGE